MLTETLFLLLLPGVSATVFSLSARQVPQGWKDVGPAPEKAVMRLRVALRQRNEKWLHEKFAAVSDPMHPEYGKYVSAREVATLMQPEKEAVAPVLQWLRGAGVERGQWHRRLGDSIVVTAPARSVARLFPSLSFRVFTCRNTTTIAALGRVQFPPTMGVDLVTGLAYFPTCFPNKKRNLKLSHPTTVTDNGAIGPAQLYRLYGIDAPSMYPLSSSHGQAVVEFLGSGAYMPYYLRGNKDYKSFFALAGIPDPPAQPRIVGPFKPDEGELEASLDVEYLMAMGRGATTYYWTEPRWMYDWASDFAGQADPEKIDVVSISYSWSEVNQCTQPDGSVNPTCRELGVDSAAYVKRTNTEFQKIGVTGVTLVVSSGDDGAPGNIDGAKCRPDLPLDSLFPAASPYVTTVGGTMLKREVASPALNRTVTQKTCKNKDCTKGCQVSYLPIGKCLVSEDNKNSAKVACGIGEKGNVVKETIYAGSKKCEGLPNTERIPCNTCLTDTAGTYVWFECKLEDEKASDLCVQNGGCATSTHEIVATYPEATITSGGGFSRLSARPAWQEKAVSGYLEKEAASLPPRQYYNASGRGYPDVAALARNYAVWMGMWMPTDGTSASTPVVAGIFSIINEHLVKANRSRLGFAAPLLYHLHNTAPQAFKDITEGNNKCASTCCGKHGYNAAAGWDPVTGLGALDANELIKAVLALQTP